MSEMIASTGRRLPSTGPNCSGVQLTPEPHFAARAVGDQELATPLLLRIERRPRLAGLIERRDLVLIPVLVARLDADDVGDRDAVVGRRRRHVGGRMGGVVGLEAGERVRGLV